MRRAALRSATSPPTPPRWRTRPCSVRTAPCPACRFRATPSRRRPCWPGWARPTPWTSCSSATRRTFSPGQRPSPPRSMCACVHAAPLARAVHAALTRTACTGHGARPVHVAGPVTAALGERHARPLLQPQRQRRGRRPARAVRAAADMALRAVLIDLPLPSTLNNSIVVCRFWDEVAASPGRK
jgi:hypothetical protein